MSSHTALLHIPGQHDGFGSGRPEQARAVILGGSVLFALLLALLYVYWSGIQHMVHQWSSDETYGHGFLVPFVSGYLIYRQRRRLAALPIVQQGWGLVPVIIGSGLYFLGEIGTVYVLVQMSLWLVGLGLLVTAQGLPRTKQLAFPLCYLLTAIPLPQFLYQSLSTQMQLLSSAAGVGWLHLIGITAFRDGNVIDLGPIQLQVVEACSGLRYLFPLCALALLCGYFHRGPTWQRLALFLSSLPIAVLLNGFRIAVVGILVESIGPSSAEGFLHLFEGWVIFLASVGMLWGEMLLLAWLWPQTIAVESSSNTAPTTTSSAVHPSPTTRPYAVAVGAVLLLAVAASYTVHREEMIPSRHAFIDFPMHIAEWTGAPGPLEEPYRNALKLDDYLLADYQTAAAIPVTFYAAYYESQRKGQSVHSPQSCIPGGGWEIVALEQRPLSTGLGEPREISINRVVITKAQQTQIVYYWFKQRDRSLSNEYLVKGYLFWDALVRQRTDGALVRLSAPVVNGQPESATDDRLSRFAALVVPLLDDYIPD